MVEFPLKGEQQKAMLFRADLHLFVRGFEVNACTHEGSWSCVDSARSDAIGRLRRSGRWHLVFTWRTVLSRTRRGSLDLQIWWHGGFRLFGRPL